MRMMNIVRKAKKIEGRVQKSRIGSGCQNAQQEDEIRFQDAISISNHEFCARREKYTKEIREELDPRDKEFTFPFQTTFNITLYLLQKAATLSQNQSNQQENKNDKEQKKSNEYLKLRRAVFDYVSQVCQNVNSIAFRLLSKGELTDGQTKAFAVKIILANIQSVLTDIHAKLQQYAERQGKPQLEKQSDDLMEKLTISIDEELSQVFSQLAGHYPQAPPAGATAHMREVIVDVNQTQDEQNNLIFSSDIKIARYVKISQDGRTILSQPEDYTGFVMEVINKVIEITRTIVDQDQSLFQKFQEFNERLFAFTNTDKKTQKLSPEDKNRLAKLTSSQRVSLFQNVLSTKKAKQQPQTQQQRQQQKQLQASLQFQQRIVEQYKKHHKNLLAQKIPNHVKQFSHADIKEANFRVNHSSVLRIMTKLVESLEDIFEKSEQEIEERLYKFKDFNNKLIEDQIDKPGYQGKLKAGLSKNLQEEYKSVKAQLNNLKAENTLFQSYILSEVQSQSSYLKRFSKVREASAQINAIAIEYTKKYLCILIHHLIKAGHYQFIKEQLRLLSVNLVVFRVGDLLRSKLQCSERSFINVMNILQQLDNSKQMEGKFKLVRIKNKLHMRDNNVLINYMFMGKVQCELQLSVQKMDDRDKHYYEFCHFLYQLTRGKLGVITECATVVCQHDSIINSSTDAYYRPKCYEVLQRKKKTHRVHKKDKDIYKCISCGQLKMGENTSLFQEENQCNQCIIKRDEAQQKMRDKNNFLLKQKRIRRYGEIQNGDYIISVNNQKTDAILKLYKAWKPQEQLRLFLVEINEYVLSDFQKQDFQYNRIDYFNILAKKKKNQDLKELTYNLGKKITAQALESIKIDSSLFQKIQPFFQANRNYRMEKMLIKSIQFKSEFIEATNNKQKWDILKKVVSAYSCGNVKHLRYRKYKTLDWMHIKSISLQRDGITSAKQLLELAKNCTKLELERNKITQINLQKLDKLQYLSIWNNQISSIDLKNNRLLTTLHLNENKLKEIELSSNTNLLTLCLYTNQLQKIDISSNIKLTTLKLSRNQLQKIDLSSNINLETLTLLNNQLQQVNLSSNINLTQLHLSNNKLKEIDLRLHSKLKQLTIFNNKLEHINLQGNPKLNKIWLQDNKLQSAKFWISELPNIDYLLDNQQSKQCKVTLLYRKQHSQKFETMLERLKQKYKMGSAYNKHQCQFIFLGEERL